MSDERVKMVNAAGNEVMVNPMHVEARKFQGYRLVEEVPEPPKESEKVKKGKVR